MNEIFSMWKKTKMVVLVALCAGLYAALLIPFKGFVLIPGVTEFRPASTLPVVMGLLFGPAGAWGSAIGNLIGDFFGSLGIGSIFGFIGNFFFAYVPYKLWLNLGLVPQTDLEPNLSSRRKIFAYVFVSLLSSMSCALVISWGLEVMGLLPFAALASIITINNSIPSVVLGIPIMVVVYPRVKKWDLLWTDVLDENKIPVRGAISHIGGLLMTLSILFGLLGGLLAAMNIGQTLLYSGFGAAAGSLRIITIAGIGVAGLVASMFLQNMPKK